MKIKIKTDTASIAIFDPGRMSHRKDDSDDWWSDPWVELSEVNSGNMALIGVPEDGAYEIFIDSQCNGNSECVECLVACESGELWVGPGESLPAEGLCLS